MTTYTNTHGGIERIGNGVAAATGLLRAAIDGIGRAAGRTLANWQAVQQARANQRIQSYLSELERIDPTRVADYRAWADEQDGRQG
jgi:hypothetical protein